MYATYHPAMTPPADPNDLSLGDLYARFASTGNVRRLLELARDEDLGPDRRDVTTGATHDTDRRATARIVFRQGGVISGLATIPDLIEVFGGEIDAKSLAADGDVADAGAAVCELQGSAHAILRLERTALNLIARLSGVATRTRAFVDEIASSAPGTNARVFDTRKTTPGLRLLEKYAVRCGAGHCHRLGLYDAVLIKDNHLAGLTPESIAAFVTSAAERARANFPGELRFIEVEVDTLEQLDALLELPPATIDIVLLDNMVPRAMSDAVRRRDARSPELLLEASGGVRLETIGEIARTGVDRISVGGLTHHAVSLDIALEVDP